ncbi:GNAT family N-acetyltransferase [Sanyastnella coralliicola]|uniref:GNAT family N-acetyltransferase n=1 Tax=Sanyastnella coralliicola TaxID=3069118 RepID=UPI0027B8C2B0|nr:GNAT family N-acetyltransferase [Longitalea sp. SCSIO 12813]
MSAAVEIVPYRPEFREAFGNLNFEWLEKFFYIEDYDREVLTNPEKYILDPGGYIFMALVDGHPAGTVALIKRDEGDFELSKMGVNEKYQGKRIGQKLMYHSIAFAGEQNWHRVFLDSNRKLTPAITLYHKVGFKEIEIEGGSPYERCNIRMEILI